MEVIGTKGVPIYDWAKDKDMKSMEQAIAIAERLPVHHHVATMADRQLGYGVPIGGVVPLLNAISPYAVGNDIGCGMHSVKLSATDLGEDDHITIRQRLRNAIPMGFSKHTEPWEWPGFDRAPKVIDTLDLVENGKLQLGTLGGGNHFIEIQKGSDGHIWFTIHSGSRNLGKKLCDFFHGKALEYGVSDIPELAYFELDSPWGEEYFQVMNWALDYARVNRQLMADIILAAFWDVDSRVTIEKEIDIHHNYASVETHFGKEVVVHRKGATSAKAEEYGVIPGSCGSSTFIVRGLGNPDSFYSCSHGAGRVMGRMEATGLNRKGKQVKEPGITVEQAQASIGDLRGRFGPKDVDEAPGAYKDIHEVMAAQADLVRVEVELNPYQFIALKA